MYTPAAFLETDAAVIDAVMARFPLATVVAMVDGAFLANPVPVLRRGDRLIGHIARNNDMHRVLPQGAPVLAVFQGADAYVSPNWYPSKAETHMAVPTWNYQTVHVHGRIFFSHAEGEKRRIVSQLTTVHEQALHGPEAWRMGDAPDAFLAAKLADIVAFEVQIDRVDAKSKMSQNRDPADRDSVADHLRDKAWIPLSK